MPAAAPATRSRTPGRRVLTGTGNGLGSSPWIWAACQRRSPVTPGAGGETGEAERPELPDRLPQRHVGDEAEPVAERPVRRDGADLEHLEIDRAAARDPALDAADQLLDLGQDRRARAPGELGQRPPGARRCG